MVQPLPPVDPPTPPRGTRPGPVQPPTEPEQLPELAGTLLGEQPSAVFLERGRLVTVGVGERFHSWTVVSVSHGEAVVRGRSGTRRLRTVGQPAAPGARLDVVPIPARAIPQSQRLARVQSDRSSLLEP